METGILAYVFASNFMFYLLVYVVFLLEKKKEDSGLLLFNCIASKQTEVLVKLMT